MEATRAPIRRFNAAHVVSWVRTRGSACLELPICAMRSRFAVILLTIGGVVVGAAPSAHGYCLRTACGDNAGARCTPAGTDDCGSALRWPDGRVVYSVISSAAMSGRDPAAVIHDAFDVWRSADCGGGRHPAIQIIETSTEQTSNLVQLLAMPTPERGTDATTTLRFHEGALSLGDIVFYQLSDDRKLNASAVHEAGHFLGLMHSDDRAAVMSEALERGVGVHANLAPDDVAAICAAYPPPVASNSHSPVRVAAIFVVASMLGLALRRRRRTLTT